MSCTPYLRELQALCSLPSLPPAHLSHLLGRGRPPPSSSDGRSLAPAPQPAGGTVRPPAQGAGAAAANIGLPEALTALRKAKVPEGQARELMKSFNSSQLLAIADVADTSTPFALIQVRLPCPIGTEGNVFNGCWFLSR